MGVKEERRMEQTLSGYFLAGGKMACNRRRQSSHCSIAIGISVGGQVEVTKMSLPRPTPGRGFRNAVEPASLGGQTPRPLSELWRPRSVGRLSCVVGLALLFPPRSVALHEGPEATSLSPV
ncbi:hypothetical protein MRX96_004853 [Rhipicephalus microplus]